jgi:dihydroorotase
MPLSSKFDGLELPASAAPLFFFFFSLSHVHLRDGAMMNAVVPTIRSGGCNTVYVMPNLIPPLTSASDAMAYKARLREQDPNINYLMTLYLHESIGPAVVKGARAQGIVGIRSYPAGVATNSSSGVLHMSRSIQYSQPWSNVAWSSIFMENAPRGKTSLFSTQKASSSRHLKVFMRSFRSLIQS